MNTRHTYVRLYTSILFFLSLLFLFFLLSGRPVHASLTGQCGDNVYFSLEYDGTVTFTGSGPMWNYTSESQSSPSPLQGNTDVRRAVIGYGITNVGDFMLQKCTNLTGVTFSETVTGIGSSSFNGCRYLQSIDLGTGLKTIGMNAFNGCEYLTTVVLPDGFTTLSEGAFANCYRLREIYIPESAAFSEPYPPIFKDSGDVTVYGIRGSAAEAMADAAGLTFREGGRCGREVIWNQEEEGTIYIFGVGPMKDYTAADPSPFCNDSRILKVRFSQWVTGVGDMAFSGCSSLMYISLPYQHSVEYFGEGAFQNCTGLEYVSLTPTVTSIGPDAFSGCTNLTDVYFADDDINIADQAFRNCPGLIFHVYPYTPAYWYAVSKDIPMIVIVPFEKPDYTTPDDLRIIEEEAFKGTPEEVIQLTDSVEKIGKRAFAECTNLRKIYIPGSVTEIAPDAFDGCPEDMIIFGEQGSAAYTLAREKGFFFALWYAG